MPQQTGVVSNLPLKPVTTSAGTVHVPDKDFREMSVQDLLALVHSAARRKDGTFTLVASAEGAGGTTLTVTTAAGATTIGPFAFDRDRVRELVDYVTREGKTRDGL